MRILLLGLVFCSTLAMLGCDDKPSGKGAASTPDTKTKPGEPPAPPPPPPPPK